MLFWKDKRKYYFVVYQFDDRNNPSLTGTGNIAITFQDGDFNPYLAVQMVKETKPGAGCVLLRNWIEISAKAYVDWSK